MEIDIKKMPECDHDDQLIISTNTGIVIERTCKKCYKFVPLTQEDTERNAIIERGVYCPDCDAHLLHLFPWVKGS